jgi:ATP/maltotriose-dependent transcriptional regulator MalT
MAERDLVSTQRSQPPAIDEQELEAIGFARPRVIGRGGFGVVYLCQQCALDRAVAVKVLASTIDSDPDNVERFLREQQAMGKISGHPNVVQVLQVGTTEAGHPFIVMPYHSSGSLERQIRDNGPLPLDEALRIVVKVAGALETVHRAGILHRDIKPANVLLTDYGEPQLTDFGIARVEGAFHTATGVITGSPAFTAPEVLRDGRSSVASDVYGLAATLFSTLSGHAAFERRSGEGLVAQFLRITAEPVPDLRPDGMPEDVCGVIESAMARDPADRPASAAAFGHLLRAVQHAHHLPVADMILAGPGTTDTAGMDGSAEVLPAFAVSSTPRSPTPPTVATRFRPALRPRPLVRRQRLLDALQTAHRPRLILIHAPAGSGKSTLAAQWAQQLIEDEGAVVGWLNADSDDNNVAWFLAHLLEAIQRSRPSLVGDLRRVIEERGSIAEHYVLTSLINNIHDSGEHLVVIIEDWHRVTDRESVAALGFLVEHCCHHLQVLVTSRSQAGLPTGKMRLDGELIEIDAAALRFEESEARGMLIDVGGLRLGDKDVAGLCAYTDGWAAGLQLASLSLRGHDDPAGMIEHMTGRHHVISQYLAENVLESLEPDLRDALMATSVTERICGDLATALTGHRHGQALLEDIERRDLFLRRIDERGRWFRYHHLFADFLRQRLERDHPEWVVPLHRAAAEWFGHHNMLSEAIDHALAADESDRAAQLVETNAMELVQHSQIATLIGLVDKLPAPSAASRPRLQMALAWANVVLRRPAQTQIALRLVTDAEAKLQVGQGASDLSLEVAIVRAVENIFADRVENIDQLIDDCISRADSLSPWLRCVVANVGAATALYQFEFDRVHAWHEWASPYFQHATGALAQMYSLSLMGLAAFEQLDTAEAEQSFRAAMQLAHASAGENAYTATLASAVLGDLLYELGRISEAEQLLDDCAKLGSAGGPVEFMSATYGTRARIKALRGNRDAAAECLSEGARMADALHLSRLAARMDNERIRLGFDHLESSDVGIDRQHADSGSGIETLIDELERDSMTRSLLRSQPDQAVACATALVESIDAAHRPRAALRAQLLRATSLAAANRIDDAAQCLAPRLARCARIGLVRPVLDEDPIVMVAVRRVVEQTSGQGLPDSFVARILADD